jgi:hypothetical protein
MSRFFCETWATEFARHGITEAGSPFAIFETCDLKPATESLP